MMHKPTHAGVIREKYDYRKTYDKLSVPQKMTLLHFTRLGSSSDSFVPAPQDIATLKRMGLLYHDTSKRLLVNQSIKNILKHHLEEIEIWNNRR